MDLIGLQPPLDVVFAFKAFPAKACPGLDPGACPGLDPGWIPVRAKKTLQSK
jgi:hypothetical protein